MLNAQLENQEGISEQKSRPYMAASTLVSKVT